LFLGEQHSYHYHRKKHKIPLSEIIVDYLQQADHVDFLFETDVRKTDVLALDMNSDEMAEYQEQIRVPKNITGNAILNQVRRLLAPYIKPYNDDDGAAKQFPAARVHWIDLDFNAGHKKSHPFLDALSDLTFRLNLENYEPFFQRIEACIMKESELTEADFLEAFRWEHSTKSNFEHRLSLQKRIFLVSLNILMGEDKVFYKCDHYTSVFMERAAEFDYSQYSFYSALHRFFMDVYTCCRILKTDAVETWYKNIIVYSGLLHTITCAKLLRLEGFSVYKI